MTKALSKNNQRVIACRPGCFRPFEAETLPMMAELGIQNIELSSAPPEDKWAAWEADLKKYGVRVTTVGCDVNFSKPGDVAAMAHTFRTTRHFGAKITFMSAKTGGVAIEEAYRQLKILGDMAAAEGVTIALETHPDLVTSGKRAATTMLAVDHPNVKLNYDTANIYYYNHNVVGVSEMLHFLPWLAAVHLKETDGGYHHWWFPGLHDEKGIVDFTRIFSLCDEIGFTGPFTMEIEGIKGEHLPKPEIVARMKRSLAYLKAIGAM